MAGHFQTLLEAIVADPDQSIAALPILTEAERHQILVEWNDTAADYPDTSIHELFEKQVEKTPDAIAVAFDRQQLTYQELNIRSNQLAHHLRQLDVGPEALVGICVERSLEMVVGLFGILKAGGAYVPLDPAYPSERVKFMLEDAQVSVVVTLEKCLEICQRSAVGGRPAYVCLDRDWPIIERGCGENPKCNVGCNNLAYVIYTSGSTGKPKGVAIEHRNASNLLHWAKTVYTRQDLESVLAATSICFDLSVFELFVPLSWGGKVELVENGLSLVEATANSEVTLINTVPSVLGSDAIGRGLARHRPGRQPSWGTAEPGTGQTNLQSANCRPNLRSLWAIGNDDLLDVRIENDGWTRNDWPANIEYSDIPSRFALGAGPIRCAGRTLHRGWRSRPRLPESSGVNK